MKVVFCGASAVEIGNITAEKVIVAVKHCDSENIQFMIFHKIFK